jgi:plastocyanin
MRKPSRLSQRLLACLVAALLLATSLALPPGQARAEEVYVQKYDFREMHPYRLEMQPASSIGGIFDYVKDGLTKLLVFSPQDMYGISVYGSLVAYVGEDRWTSLYCGYKVDAIDRKNHQYEFTDLWGPDKNHIYLVNLGTQSPMSPGLYLYNGADLTRVEGVENPARIWGLSADEIYVARGDGGLYRYDGFSWSLLDYFGGKTVTCLDGFSVADSVYGTVTTAVYAGTAEGLHYFDGRAWTPVTPLPQVAGKAATCTGKTADGKLLVGYGREIAVLDTATGQWASLGQAPHAPTKLAGTALDDLYAVMDGKLYLRKADGNWYQVRRQSDELLAATVCDFHVFDRRDFLVVGLGTPYANNYFDTPILYYGSTIPAPPPVNYDREVTAYLRVEGYDRTIIPRTRISVARFGLGSAGGPYLNPGTGSSANPYSQGWEVDRFEGPTALHILLKALTDRGFTKHDPNNPVDGPTEFDVQDYGWALYVAMIGGDREFDQGPMSGWLYRVNGWLPNYGSQAYYLNDGDEVVWYYSATGFDAWYVNFRADREEVEPGETVHFTLTGERTDLSAPSGVGETEVRPIPNATLLVNGQPWLVGDNPVTTDSQGRAAITFTAPGTYEVSCEGWNIFGADGAVKPASILITVASTTGDHLQVYPTVEPGGLITLSLQTAYPGQPVTLVVEADSTRYYIDQFDTDSQGQAEKVFRLPPGREYTAVVAVAGEKEEFTLSTPQAPTDTTPPAITVTGLSDGMSVALAELSFTVAAEDETDGPVTPVVRLNQTLLTPAEGGSYTCTLAEGSNSITVEATDAAGNKAHRTYTVYYQPQAQDALITRVRQAIGLVTNYVKTQGTYSSDWLVVGLRNAGEEIPANYLSNVTAEVQNYFATIVNTKLEKVTDHERRVLGIVAAGGDPRNVGGYNLLERIYNFYIPANPPAGPSQPRDITFQGLNGVIYGLIALDTMRWPIPADARYSRDWMIQYLLEHQNADGGWDLGATGNSDVDITAMTLIGLAPYRDREDVSAAIDRAVEWLAQKQAPEGGYYSWGTYNSESVSQAIIALCANGIDPTSERFTKNKNLVEALLDFLQADGSILHTLDGSGVTGMATEQGYQALLAYDKFVRHNGAYNGGRTSIYYFGEYAAVKVAGKATDPSVTLAAGNREVAQSDNAWSIQLTSGTVKDNLSAADLTLTGLPAGLSAAAAKGEGNTVIITVTGAAHQALSRLTPVTVVIKASAVVEPGAVDSAPITLYLNPAPVRQQEVMVSEAQKDLTLDQDSPAATVTVPQNVTEARLNLIPLVTETEGQKRATIPQALTVQAETSAGQVKVEIPQNTGISAPLTWAGTLNLPTIKPNSSVTVTPDPGKTATVQAVIEVGAEDQELVFDRAVRLVFAGQAGKEVGYYRQGVFTKITTVMTSDSQQAGDALPAGGDGRIDVGQDLVVWTKHLTRFVIYTQTTSGSGGQPPSSGSVSVYIRVEGYDCTIVPRTRVVVDNFDLTPYLGPASGISAEPSPGWGPDKLTKPTVAHALIRALESVGIDCTDHDSGLDLQDYGWALYVAMIAGDREFDYRSTSGWLYRVNGVLPDYGCQAYTLKGGEDIVWYFAVYGFETWYTQLSASKTSAKTGEEITLTLTGTKTDLSGSSGTGPTVSAKLKGAVIYVNGQEYQPEGTPVATDENGQAVIRFYQPGTYEVSAERYDSRGLRDMVRPVPVTITVTGSAIVPGGPAAPVSDTALEEALKKAATTGVVALEADGVQTLLVLSREQLSKIWEAKKPLAVSVQGVQFVLSADSLKVPEVTAAGTAQLELKAQKLDASAVRDLLAALGEQHRLVGEVYELDLAVVDKDGKRQSVARWPDLRVILPVPEAAKEAAAAGRVKAYRYDEAKQSWEEVGGTYDAAQGTISVKVEHLSKYALLESLSPAAAAAVTTAPGTAKTFPDIAGHWAQKEIEFMAGKGYVVGISEDRFAPEATVTRAQFAVILARMAGLAPNPEAAARFGDIPADAWYRGMVGAAAAAGLVSGTGERTFSPQQPITREQMAAMMVRLLAKSGPDLSIDDRETARLLAGFADAGEISTWAKNSVALAVREGLMRGRQANRFEPRGQSTRAEAAVVLYRLLQKLPELGK